MLSSRDVSSGSIPTARGDAGTSASTAARRGAVGGDVRPGERRGDDGARARRGENGEQRRPANRMGDARVRSSPSVTCRRMQWPLHCSSAVGTSAIGWPRLTKDGAQSAAWNRTPPSLHDSDIGAEPAGSPLLAGSPVPDARMKSWARREVRPACSRSFGLLVRRALEQLQVLAVALARRARDRDEAHRRGVHAVAHARSAAARRRRRGRGASRACAERTSVRAMQSVRSVFVFTFAGIERLREARPAGARVVLVERAEQRLARDDVDVDPGLVVVPVLVAERRARCPRAGSRWYCIGVSFFCSSASLGFLNGVGHFAISVHAAQRPTARKRAERRQQQRLP